MMQYEQTEYLGDVQILNRKPFEAIPMTLDFSSVSDKLANGKKVVKAGTPIGPAGVLDNTGTVVGILLHDVTEDRPQGTLLKSVVRKGFTLLKKAYIKTEVAKTHSGVTIEQAVKTALPMVVFE